MTIICLYIYIYIYKSIASYNKNDYRVNFVDTCLTYSSVIRNDIINIL